MKQGELCPKCKKGHMHFQGKRDVYRIESKKPFRPLDEKTGLVCDNCGYEQEAEHRSISDDVRVSPVMVTAKVTKGKTKTRKNVLAPKKSNVNKTKKETTMTKSCFCGCEQFSFKMNKEVVDNDPQHLYYNICSNCNHSLGSHITVVRSKQAD
jgi:DNA-directed RNA polymerase subunit M/transcription elongation factor TFIIS